MYYPSKRRAWGRIPQEKDVLLLSARVYVLMEIAVWSAAAVYGVPWAGDMASTILAPVAVLVALIAGLWLGFQLGKVDDMCSVGRESLHIGGFMIGSALIYVAILAVPMPTLAFKYAHVAFSAIRNVAPVREILKHTDPTRTGPGGFYLMHGVFPRTSGRHAARRAVACEAQPKSATSQASNAFDRQAQLLDDIMHFLPLRDAFGEFCRKALCSESFDFLVAVADFKHVVHAAFDRNNKETAAGDDFHKFVAIVKEYIESDARSEVNIDDHAKHEALLYTEQHDYLSLSMVKEAEPWAGGEHEAETDW
eukprot:g20498.t1